MIAIASEMMKGYSRLSFTVSIVGGSKNTTEGHGEQIAGSVSRKSADIGLR